MLERFTSVLQQLTGPSIIIGSYVLWALLAMAFQFTGAKLSEYSRGQQYPKGYVSLDVRFRDVTAGHCQFLLLGVAKLDNLEHGYGNCFCMA